ncbi:type I-G CRISPR-associated helicase/endonuclease Cas3g [Ornithinimicrobium sp. Y1847]|uniref:type I-G CRISPR-associated helicase/endonuclease Cas3g n=1 Tax=Ornithinimicrobium sp. Y1847 TaxID=3405419 RepID=UPI003B67AF4F
MADVPRFADLFSELVGAEPYEWQERAAQQWVAGEAPDEISVPTGMGKTLLMVVWLFALLRDLEKHRQTGAKRQVPLRYHHVAPRRVVVDDSATTAMRIGDALESPKTPALSAAREILVEVFGTPAPGDRVLEVVVLRGGMEDRPENTRQPARPVVIVGTVQLVGSRLLGRPYGVAPARRPIEMALTCTDSVLVIDEAHLVRQFVETARTLARWVRAEDLLSGSIPPLRVIGMTATPRQSETYFDRAAEERRRPAVAERLARRRATPVSIVEVTTTTADGGMAHVVKSHDFAPKASTLVFSNTRDGAIKVSKALATRRDLPTDTSLLTLVGGMPDRVTAPLVEGELSALRPGRSASPAATLIVSATQTLEAGADLDAQHGVVPVASGSALRQRIGRVNRLGLHEEASITIVVSPDATRENVYGESAARLSRALVHHRPPTLGDLDDLLDSAEAQAWEVESTQLAVLPRFVFDAYQRTGGSPHDPPVGRWLVQPEDPLAEISIVFRDSVNDIENDAALQGHLSRCRPQGGELWSIPLPQARQLVRGVDRWALFHSADPEAAPLICPEADSLRAGDIAVLPSASHRLPLPRWGEDLVGVRDVAPFVLMKGEKLTDDHVGSLVTPLLDELGRETGWVELVPVRERDEHCPSAPYPLAQHHDDVAQRVREICSVLGVPLAMTEDLVTAARLHDEGKTHPGLQAALCHVVDGDGILNYRPSDQPIGKSALPRRLWRRVNSLAGVPAALRHEAVSASLYDERLAKGAVAPTDARLVRHLILTHHGGFRGFGPVLQPDEVSSTAYQDPERAEWVERPAEFRELLERYGPCTIALTEALLRLADWDASRRVT